MSIGAVQPARFPIAFAIGTGLCLLALTAGVPLSAALSTTIGCGMILAIGLPHGTLDLDLFLQDQPGVSRPRILLLYLAFVGVMAGAWLFSPVGALALFYTLAVAHFSEDWRRTGSMFMAQGMVLAMLALPALSHPGELAALFAALTGADASAVFVDLLRLVAPVATLVALAAVGLLWSLGERNETISAGLALVAMALLPPVVGFALFFCLLHSPRHLRDSLAALPAHTQGKWSATIVLLTLAAGGIAALIYSFGGALPVSDRVVAASFMTLSILTLPHMAVPIVLRALRQDASRRAGGLAIVGSAS